MSRIEEEDIVREALSNALAGATDATSVDRILEAAFFRKRPLQAGAQPVNGNVVSLSERRRRFDEVERRPAEPERHRLLGVGDGGFSR